MSVILVSLAIIQKNFTHVNYGSPRERIKYIDKLILKDNIIGLCLCIPKFTCYFHERY